MKNNPSQRPRWLPPVMGGVLCAVLTGLATWYDLARNGGRLVYPMHSYAFQTSDIPMLLALVLDFLYVLYLLLLLVKAAASRRERVRTTRRTRQLNPRLGFLGCLGLLGFAGFFTYSCNQTYFPFCFFCFFGFFGFFFEGKMSNTLMDERYQENALRAQRDAYRAGIAALFLIMLIAGQGRASAELAVPMLLIGISLDLALTLFLSEYLLYRYDHGDAAELEEDE